MAARRPAATSTRGAAPALPRAAKPRASRSGSDGVFDPFSAFSLWLFRWRTTGLLIAAAGVALVVLALADRQQLNHLGAPLVRTLGAGVFIVAPVVIGMGVLVFLGRLRITVARLWLTAGWMMAAAVLWGTLSYFRPDWRLAGESIAAVTLGGAVGSAIGRTPLGVLAMTICFVGASLLVWPRFTWWTVGLLPPACRMIASWRIPQRAWRTASEGLRAMFNTGDSEAAPARRVPSVPEFDDLDVDTTRFVRQQPSAEDDSPPQMPNVNPAAPPAEAKPGKLARLRRGESPRQAAMDLPEAQAVTEVAGAWPRPPRDLLHPGATPEVSLAENESRAHTIVKALASHGVDAQVVSIKQGPTVTQFGVEPGWEVKYRTVVDRDGAGRPVIEKDGRQRTHQEEVSRQRVRVNQVTRLHNDLALALAAPTIRIEAPVPGKPVIGIEVPNLASQVVTLRQVVDSPEFQKLAAKSRLALALGVGVSGQMVVADLARMPHLLIAGATGSGKSVCINSLITCILMHATPEEVRLVLIDPKQVEMAGYESVPHLAFSKVIVDMQEVIGTLSACVKEMEERYRAFRELGVRNLEGYNNHPKIKQKLPQWVVIIDELADLMQQEPMEIEGKIQRLTQLARAAGIHVVIATQRPSVDVITGVIKSNLPARIAFQVASQVDSRTILDIGGAEKLIGRGDMLYLPGDAPKPGRVQGVFVSDKEIEDVVAFWSSERFAGMRPPKYDHLIAEAAAEQAKADDPEEDPLMERARELAEEHSRISTSMLQRRLRIGYPRAARLMDQLEEEGLVGDSDGGESRPVTFGD